METFADDLPLARLVATIAFVDVAESVRLISTDEARSVQRIRSLLSRAARDIVPAFGGRLVERQGDGLVLRFDSVRQALACARALHGLAAAEAPGACDWMPLQLRVGVHCGALLADAAAVYGMTVNLAARIAAIGQPGDTVLSADARDEAGMADDLGMPEDLGWCHLKHVDTAVRLFRWRHEPGALSAPLHEAIGRRMGLRPTLVVLPGAVDGHATGGPGMAVWADIATEQLCARLGLSPHLHVISALSSRALRSARLGLSDLYERWHAQYVLRWRLQALGVEGAELRSRVRLVGQLWRQGAPEPVHEVDVQGFVGELVATGGGLLCAVVESIGERMLAIERRAVQDAALPNLAAHALYLHAVDLLHRFSLVDFSRAREALLALHERAPRHAQPLAWLARWHVFRIVQGWSDDSRRDGELAFSYSARALDCDPASALALTLAGSVKSGVQRDQQAAQALYDQALQANPNESLAWLMSGVAKGFLSQPEAAIAASESALGLAPMDPTRHYYDSLAASAAVIAGRYERGIELAKRCLQANRLHGSAYRALAAAQVLVGQTAAAHETVLRLLAVEPHCTVQTYLARAGVENDNNLRLAQALREAGLPER